MMTEDAKTMELIVPWDMRFSVANRIMGKDPIGVPERHPEDHELYAREVFMTPFGVVRDGITEDVLMNITFAKPEWAPEFEARSDD